MGEAEHARGAGIGYQKVAVVIEGHFEFGSSPPTDEGWQAHIFQLMMVFQLPIIVLFVVASWRSLKRSLPVIGAQAFLFLLALGALRYFNL